MIRLAPRLAPGAASNSSEPSVQIDWPGKTPVLLSIILALTIDCELSKEIPPHGVCAHIAGCVPVKGLLDMSGASLKQSCDIGCCPLPLGSEATVWEALANDTGAFVLVIDEDGVVVCCNDLVNEQIGAEHAPLQGKTLDTFCSAEVAAEYLGFIRESIERRRPINIIGMCHGVATRSTVRPLPPVDCMKSCVIKVVLPLNEMDVQEVHNRRGAWVTATSFDLGRLSALTPRELDVLRLIGESMTTAEIADRLHRSAKTIEWHRVSLGSKLGAANRVELARIAASAGLQYLEDETFAKIRKLSNAEQAVHPF